MRISFALAVPILAVLCNANAHGHGTPISLHADTALIANGGVSDTLGFAPMMYFEAGDTGDPFATIALPTIGPVTVWQIPGIDMSGLSPTASLSIEVLARPANNVLPPQARTLWYWNPASGEVEPTSAPIYLLGTGQRVATVDPALSAPPAPFLLANQVGGTQAEGGQQGFHNHGLLSYALDNDYTPPAENGAYGFFARLISNQYAPSDPFLIVLNRGVDYERMTEAALAINAAAFLPGDFNHDDRVDAADYVIWRDSMNTPEDYALWRGGFGATFPPLSGTAAEVAGTTNVPEPGTAAFVACIVAGAACASRHRRIAGACTTRMGRATREQVDSFVPNAYRFRCGTPPVAVGHRPVSFL